MFDRQRDFVGSAKLRREISRSLLKAGRFEESLLYAKAALRDLESLGSGALPDIEITRNLIELITSVRDSYA